MLGLRYFTMLCNDAEYKNMDQDEILGQLYDVQIWIKVFYKQSGWAYSFSMTQLMLSITKLTGYCYGVRRKLSVIIPNVAVISVVAPV